MDSKIITFNNVKDDVEIIKTKIKEYKTYYISLSTDEFLKIAQEFINETKELINFDYNFNKDKLKIIEFITEIKFLKEYPELYDNYMTLVKRLCKSDDYTMLNKFIEELDKVHNGNKSLASVELKLGMELKNQFYDSKK
jgi:hypothetical protein